MRLRWVTCTVSPAAAMANIFAAFVLEDFEAALRQHKPGDQVKVTVRRDGKLIEADVTLARRRPMP